MSDVERPLPPPCGAAALEAARVLALTQIAQTLALAVQDAGDHLRNVEAVAAVAQGTVLRRMLETGNGPEGAETLAMIQMMVTQGQDNLERVGNLARAMLGSMRP